MLVQPFAGLYSISVFPEQIAEAAIPLTTSKCQGRRKVKQFFHLMLNQANKNFFPNLSLLSLHLKHAHTHTQTLTLQCVSGIYGMDRVVLF